MIKQDFVVRKGMKKCGLCEREPKVGETVIRFSSGGKGAWTHNENICQACIVDIAMDVAKAESIHAMA